MNEAERSRLILEYDSLPKTIAQEFRGGSIDYDDLVAEGFVALTERAASYHPAMGEFKPWAIGGIRERLSDKSKKFSDDGGKQSEWFPKEDDPAHSPIDSDKIERIYEWGSWGDRGSAEAICERWSALDVSPEQLFEMYEALQDKHNLLGILRDEDKFRDAFISLTSIQRKLVDAVYLRKKPLPITDAAREIGISYWRAVRNLNKALLIMRQVIVRMEHNRNKPPQKAALSVPGSA